jgi:arylsulfatase
LYDSEAWRNNAYPTAPLRRPQPSPAAGKTSFTYREGVTRLPLAVAPPIGGRSHIITADIDVPASGASGVVVAEGGRFGGFTLYVADNKVSYENNAQGHVHQIITAPDPLPSGKVQLVWEFTADGGSPGGILFGSRPVNGHGQLWVNGKRAGAGDITSFGSFGYGETFDVGADLESPVSARYDAPFAFTGKIEKITLDLK